MLGSVDLLIRMVCGSVWKNGGLLLVLVMLIFILIFVDLGLFEKICKWYEKNVLGVKCVCYNVFKYSF